MAAWTNDVIETQRLRLRAGEPDDLAVVVRLLVDPDVRRYLGGAADRSVVDAVSAADLGTTAGVFSVDDRVGGQMIGSLTLGSQHGEPELSYTWLPEAWGRGLAHEAIVAMLDWIWRNHAHESVIAVTQTANTRSCRLLERLDFAFEREFEEWGAPQSQYRLTCPA